MIALLCASRWHSMALWSNKHAKHPGATTECNSLTVVDLQSDGVGDDPQKPLLGPACRVAPCRHLWRHANIQQPSLMITIDVGHCGRQPIRANYPTSVSDCGSANSVAAK